MQYSTWSFIKVRLIIFNISYHIILSIRYAPYHIIMKFCFHTTKEMTSMLLVVAVDITVIVRVHQNLLEKLDDLYSLRLVAHTQWSLWDLVI